MILPFSKQKLIELTTYWNDRVPYQYGSKAYPIQDELPRRLDCSGFFRAAAWHQWNLAHKTGAIANYWEDLGLPDGSQAILEWLQKKGFQEIETLHVHVPDADTVAFVLPADASHDGIGHIGFIDVAAARTMECYGSHGVGFRDIENLPWLESCHFFVWSETL